MQPKSRLLASVYCSNALEFFDYTIFGAFSVVIAKTFFGSSNQQLSDYLAILAFCISLLIRPIGSLIFGYIGDNISRIRSLRLSILCMTAASLSMAFLPSYEHIGVFAIIVVFASRILQGISAGGEYNGAAIFALEECQHQSWWISGLLTSSAIMGLVLASTFSLTQKLTFLPSWFWRIGFVMGAMIGVSSYFLRNTSTLRNTNKKQKTQTTYHYIKKNLSLFFFIFCVGGQTSSLCYWLFIAVNDKTLPLNTTGIDLIYHKIIYLLTASLASIYIGHINQKQDSEKYVPWVFLCTITLMPLLFVITYYTQHFFIPFFMIALLIGQHGSQQHVIFQRYVDPLFRQRFISIAFSLGTGILSTLTIFVMKNLSFTTVSIDYFWFSLPSLGALIFYQQMRQKNAVSNLQS